LAVSSLYDIYHQQEILNIFYFQKINKGHENHHFYQNQFKDEHVHSLKLVLVKMMVSCLFIFWNKKYSEIPVDDKYPYKGAYCQTKLSLDE